jgi:hypothetical protein
MKEIGQHRRQYGRPFLHPAIVLRVLRRNFRCGRRDGANVDTVDASV